MLNNQVIANRIKSLRKEKGMTQYELAHKIGVSVSTITMYENGERIPRDDIKVKLSEALNESIQHIFFDC